MDHEYEQEHQLEEALLGATTNSGPTASPAPPGVPCARTDGGGPGASSDRPPDASAAGTTGPLSAREELAEMVSLALPIAASAFCRKGMVSADKAFVGHLGDDGHGAGGYLAAFVLADMCLSVLMVPPLAFSLVLNSLVGQAVGSGRPKMAGVWFQQSLFWLAVSLPPCLVGLFYVEPALLVLGFDQDLALLAGTYAKYNVIWPVSSSLYTSMRIYFQAQGLPRPAMYNNIAFLFINAFLNYVFIFGGPFRHFAAFGHWRGLGFVGAAVSLSISRTAQLAVYFVYMFVLQRHHRRTWPGLSPSHHTRARTAEFLRQALPGAGTLFFQQCSGRAVTVLVGRLGGEAVAASSVVSAGADPLWGTLTTTARTVSAVRVGYHLGRGDGAAARRAAWLVLRSITVVDAVAVTAFVPLQEVLLGVVTNDRGLRDLAATLIPAVLVSTYLNLVVDNITAGVFAGMGRPVIATVLSFGLELPMMIGASALYIIKFHGNLLGVYWLQAGIGGFEVAVVLIIMTISNWDKYAQKARKRQEVPVESLE